MPRAALPHALTGTRLVLGAAALVAAMDGRTDLAATLITLGAVTDGLDGWVSRWLGAATPFGALFDYFADYVCFIVAPWALARELLGPPLSPLQEVLIGLPLMTGAIRYARNSLVVIQHEGNAPDLPGALTIFFSFVSVTAVFLDASTRLSPVWLSWTLTGSITILSLAMVAPVRYPKLTRFRGALPVVLVLLVCMPFVATELLAWATIGLGVTYLVLAPWWGRARGI